jgi:hypothetical protein
LWILGYFVATYQTKNHVMIEELLFMAQAEGLLYENVGQVGR